MTFHFALAALAVVLAGTTLLSQDWRGQRAAAPAFARAQERHEAMPGQGFAAAFGEGAVLRNLLY